MIDDIKKALADYEDGETESLLNFWDAFNEYGPDWLAALVEYYHAAENCWPLQSNRLKAARKKLEGK